MTNYLLWLNRFDRNPDGLGIAVVEAVATNLNRVASGDPAFVQGIAEVLHLPLRVCEWSICAFRSSYYSSYPESDDWRDQFPQAWRITLVGHDTGATAHAAAEAAMLSPVSYDGYDSTWDWRTYPRDSPHGRYMAIGAYFGGGVPPALLTRVRALRHDALVETFGCAVGALTGTRIAVDLGPLDPAYGLDDMAAAQRLLGTWGLLADWSTVRHRVLRLER